MILPRSTFADVLAGKVTTARVPLSMLALDVYYDGDGAQHQQPIVPDSFQASAGKPRTEDMGPSEPAKAGETRVKLRVIACERVRLDEITDEQAHQLGFPGADEWADAWYETYAKAVTGEDGYELRFEIDKRARKHGLRIPWDPGSEQAGMRRAPEPEQISPHLATGGAHGLAARQKWARAKLDQQRQKGRMPLGEQIERELAAARAEGVDVIRYEQRIQAALRSLEARRRKDAA